MFDKTQGLRPRAVALAVGLALGLSGCGGGSGVKPSPPPSPQPPPTSVPPSPPTSISGNFEINFNDATRTWDQGVSGTGQLIKQGNGRLVLKEANTYTGGTLVAGGTVEVAPNATLGSGTARVGLYTSFYYPSVTLQVDGGASLSNLITLGQNGTLDNAGRLGGNVDVAVMGDVCNPILGACPTALNHAGGSITGTADAVRMTYIGTVKNSDGSTIEGGNTGVWLAGGYVTNDGTGSTIRSPNGFAIQAMHGTGDVQNTGGATITSGSTAVYLQYGGKVTNGAGSTIGTTGTNHGNCSSSGDCSIFAASDLITGLTLVNQGTLVGSVQMAPAAYNYATLWAGSSLRGDLFIGSNSGSALTLGGDAGTVQRYSEAVTGKTTFAGLFFKSGNGTWIIDNNDLDAVAHTEISGGVLQVGNGGTEGSIGSATVQIGGGATLAFDRSDDVTFTGSIGGLNSNGRASLVQKGTGTLTLAEVRATSGIDLIVERGSVQLGVGQFDLIYLRNFDVANNGALVFDFDGTTSYESVISGTGSLTKQGPGMLTFWKANTYTGDTIVNRGTLQTKEALPGNVIVNPGAALSGVAPYSVTPGLPGTAGDLSNAGTVVVRAGNALVGGNYTQASTGTLAVSLGSKLDVTGTATLSGGTLEITGADTVYSGYVSNTHTNVLTAAGGVTGTFDQLVKGAGVVFTATTINYDANSVWLDTTGLNVTTAAAGLGVSYTPASMGSAQRVQGAFEQLNGLAAAGTLSAVSGDFLRAAGQFQQSPSLLAAQTSLQSLSGQLHAASAAMTFQAIDASSRALSDRFDQLLDKGAGSGMWTHDLNLGGDMARVGFDGVGFQLNGWLVGSDRQVGRSGIAGYAFGQSRGQQRLNQGFDSDHGRSTEGMLYAGWLSGHWYTQGRVGFGQFQQDVSRQILLGNSAQGVRTQYNGRYGVAYGESGLHFGRGDSHLTPFVNVQYVRVDRDGFAEQGAGGFGLRSNAQTLDRWQVGLGVRAGHHWELGGGRAVDFSARAQWQRTLASRGDVFNASFVGLEQWQPLVGIGLSRYSGLFGAALDARLSARTALKFGYDYEMGQRSRAQMLSARLNVAL